MERIELANSLVIISGTTYVGPVRTTGANGVKVDLTVLASAGSVTAAVEMSNDLDNWTSTGVQATVTSVPGFGTAKTASASEQSGQAHVRISLTASGGNACVNAGLCLFQFST